MTTPCIDSNSQLTTQSNQQSATQADEPQIFRPISVENRQFSFLRGKELILEGLIGAGKSTMGQSLEKYLNSLGLKAKYFAEFLHKPLLDLYLDNMEKYAFPFQVIIARERLQIYSKARRFSKKGGISIIDRGLLGDLTFARMQKEKGFISPSEYETYLSLLNHKENPEPYLTIFLECSPQTAFERMKKRNHSSEVSGYTLEYFEQLNSAYAESLKAQNLSYLRLPWDGQQNLNLDQNNVLPSETCKHILTQIVKFSE